MLRSASDEIVEVGTKNIGIGTGSFVRPVSGYTFTSAFKWRWGRLHSGVDLAVPEGTPVRASDNGKVILAENSGDGYGNYIILDHGNGFKTLYGHNSALCVSVGDIVSQGDLIAYSGNTGNSTGPHLHFEIHLDDEKVDPERFLSFCRANTLHAFVSCRLFSFYSCVLSCGSSGEPSVCVSVSESVGAEAPVGSQSKCIGCGSGVAR